MLIKQFLEGSGFLDSRLALTIELPDFNDLIHDHNWETWINASFNVSCESHFVKILHNNREVILVNEEDLDYLQPIIRESYEIDRLIIICRQKKKILENTKSLLTQHQISLLDLPFPKPENEYAKSAINTSVFETYITRSYHIPQQRFLYDLVIGILAGVISNFLNSIVL